MHISDESLTLEEEAYLEQLIADEGNSEESELEERAKWDIEDYAYGSDNFILDHILHRSRNQECSQSDIGDKAYIYYECPSNRRIGSQNFRFQKIELRLVNSSSDASDRIASKKVSAGKPSTDADDDRCYRSTSYVTDNNAGIDVLYRFQYRRQGQNYSRTHWSSWKRMRISCALGTAVPDCY